MNGIVTITPQPAVLPATPLAVSSTATSLPASLIPPTPRQPATSTPGLPTRVPATQLPPVITNPSSAILQKLVEKARLDLSTRLSILVSDVILIQASEVSWADLSLGCPKPGMMYGQMVTSGYLVVLGVGNMQYSYHSGPDQVPFYCDKPQPPIQADPVGDL